MSTCSGDGGAPLVLRMNGVPTLVGINSFHREGLLGPGQCRADGYPDVFTRVASYRTWIQASRTG